MAQSAAYAEEAASSIFPTCITMALCGREVISVVAAVAEVDTQEQHGAPASGAAVAEFAIDTLVIDNNLRKDETT